MRVVCAADVPVAASAVIRDEHTVLHERGQYRFDLWIERRRDGVRGFQAEAQTHWRWRGAGAVAGFMPRGPEVALRTVNRKTQRVVDDARRHLVIARQSGQNWQPGSIRRRPTVGAQRIGCERE